MLIYRQIVLNPMPAYELISRENAEQMLSHIPEEIPEGLCRHNLDYWGFSNAEDYFDLGYHQAYNIINDLLDISLPEYWIMKIEFRATEHSDEFREMEVQFGSSTDPRKIESAYQAGWKYARTKLKEILEKHIISRRKESKC